jgi:uncharacterized Ntn-hydrolase superfamily protein
MEKIRISLFIVLLALFSTNCFATWSVIAVDRKTGEIGIAGASCTFDVSGIASIVPRKGAIVVQAASNYYARMKGVEQMDNGATPEEILKAMMDDKFQPEKQQYGLILLDSNTKPLVYSGSEIPIWNGEKWGDDFSIMGNTLPGEQVIMNAYKAFNENRDKPLAERLMLALKAGEETGGDRRCGTQYARSAFISVYNPKYAAILTLSISGIDKGDQPAVTLLNNEFECWKKENTKKESTCSTYTLKK